MRDRGQWLEFAPRAELEEWLGTADAFLVPMSFAAAERRRMECCFPSKLVDFARFGKPLVVWGPAYCSAVRWGSQNHRALCVTDTDPSALVRALRRLADSAEDQRRFGEAARSASATEFHPGRLQEAFLGCLNGLLPTGRNCSSTKCQA
jgi:glycosyltransferase involved in cell wall biosynthesis